jgi:hypothetical protein
VEQASCHNGDGDSALGTIRSAFPNRPKTKRTGASTNEPQLKNDAGNNRKAHDSDIAIRALWMTFLNV